LTIVVLTNLEGGGPASITHHIAGIYVPALTPSPKEDQKE
jgi:hypothetical protein